MTKGRRKIEARVVLSVKALSASTSSALFDPFMDLCENTTGHEVVPNETDARAGALDWYKWREYCAAAGVAFRVGPKWHV